MPGQTDFAALARRMRSMEGAIADARADIEQMEATGHGGDGLVAATISGSGRITALRIDPSAMDPDDPQSLSDMIIAAADDALQLLNEQRTKRMSGIAENFNGVLSGIRGQADEIQSRPRVRPLHPVRKFDAGDDI